MKRLLRRGFVVSLVLLVVLGLWGGWYYREAVLLNPGPGFTRAEIEAIIAQESPVLYRDAKTPLGAFFDEEHRRYVRYAELPEAWVNAIVAAEDGNFFRHPGVDPKHIVRALWQNLRAGKLVAGGSTLTQQTAKNLYYRPDRSLKSKLVELENALRLEAHFSKEDILEFYANQFHVSANGRGLGIAARYFFDKEPAALTTKECAYIAGMVKGPANYNPFVGGTPERREAARRAAEDRTSYVLRRMHEVGTLEAAELQRLLAEPLVFRRGTFQYDRSVVLDEVQRELEEPTFVELFAQLGIDNPSTAGIRVVTTLDPVVQREAVYGLWHHLSELGASLESPSAAALRLPDRTSMPMAPGVALVEHEFVVARVGWTGGLHLDAGGRPCPVDATAAERALKLLGVKGKDPAVLAPDLPDGSYVLASVRTTTPLVCDLELRPALQGATVVLDEGRVLAMVGGNDNRNFNRVVAARRQFGSTWKPLVYEAALQLGWRPDDVLDNRRNVFPFRDVWYYPQPDHRADPWLPMALVGARSENLASVWLLYHLTDRLNAEQLRRLAELVGLSQGPGESAEAWRARLRDEEGIRSSPERFEEYAFTLAREDVLSGLAFSAHPEDALAVRSMHHGFGFSAERARQSAPEKVDALQPTLLGLEDLASRCRAGEPGVLHQDVSARRVACGPRPGFEPVPDGVPNAWASVAAWASAEGMPDDAALAALADELLPAEPIGGVVHLSTLVELRAATDRREGALAGRGPWEAEILALHPDYRVLVGIRYLQRLVAAFGVAGELPTGLTLPLGAADVSLLDMAVLYQGMLGGNRYTFDAAAFGEGSVSGLRSTLALPPREAPVSLVAEIRDASGNVLYRATPRGLPVADAVAGELVGDILRNVVVAGTGRRAAGAVQVGGVPLPIAGKTGTTNDYRNAAFVGTVPRVEAGVATWGRGYTVATYVGYDDNRSMRKGGLRVQGASGALPAWIAAAQGLVTAGLVGTEGVAAYTPGAGLTRVELVVGEGVPNMSTLVPPSRRFAPFTEPPSATPDVALLPAPPPPPPPPEESVWDDL